MLGNAQRLKVAGATYSERLGASRADALVDELQAAGVLVFEPYGGESVPGRESRRLRAPGWRARRGRPGKSGGSSSPAATPDDPLGIGRGRGDSLPPRPSAARDALQPRGGPSWPSSPSITACRVLARSYGLPGPSGGMRFSPSSQRRHDWCVTDLARGLATYSCC